MLVWVLKFKRTSLCEEGYIWNPATCSYKNGKYVRSITDEPVIMYDEIIYSRKAVPTKINSTKTVPEKSTSTSFYILLASVLITITLLKAVNIYCYLIKYQMKQKHLLPHHLTNNKLEKLLHQYCIIKI